MDRDLSTICLKCLEKSPRRRYESALDLARDLDRWRRGEPITARPVPWWERMFLWARRKPSWAALTVLVAITIPTVILLYAHRQAAEWRTERMTLLSRVQTLFDAHKPAPAIRLLADWLELSPQDTFAAARLLCGLSQHSFPNAILNHPDPVHHTQFSQDGQFLTTACADGVVRVWETGVPRLMAVLTNGGPQVFQAVLSPDGTRVATAEESGQVRIWDWRRDLLVWQAVWDDPIRSVQWHGDGRALVVLVSNRVLVPLWGSSSGWTQQVAGSLAVSGQLDRKSERVAASDDAGGVYVWEAATGRGLHRWTGHQGVVRSVQFDGTGDRLVSAGDDGTARVWDLRGNAARAVVLQHPAPVYDAVFHPGQPWVATGCADGLARLWEVSGEGSLLRELAHADQVQAVRFTPGGQQMVVASDDGMVQVWNTSTGTPIGSGAVHESDGPHVFMKQLVLAPSGRHFATVCSDRRVRLWPLIASQLPVKAIPTPNGGEPGLAAPDGRQIEAQPSQPVPWEGMLPSGMSIQDPSRMSRSHDGRRLLAPATKAIQVWEKTGLLMDRWELLREMPLVEEINSASFSPDGRRVVAATVSQSLRVWDVDTGLPLTDPIVVAEPVWGARFLAGCRWVTGLTADGPVLWELPCPEGGVPKWLGEFARAAVSGFREGRLSRTDWLEQLREWNGDPATNATYAAWAFWLLEDISSKPTSPSSRLRLIEQLERSRAGVTPLPEGLHP